MNMSKLWKESLTVLTLAVVVADRAECGVIIDFEDQSAGASVTNQYANYWSYGGLTFSSANGYNNGIYVSERQVANTVLGSDPPVTEKLFQGFGTEINDPLPSAQAGNFFANALPTIFKEGDPVIPVTVSTSGFLAQVFSGTLLDIDNGNEEVTISAYGVSNNLLASIVITAPPVNGSDPGDGAGRNWSFERTVADISYVTLTYTGGLNHDIGYAYDNFYAAPVPEPSTLTLLGTAALGLIIPVWRRRRSR